MLRPGDQPVEGYTLDQRLGRGGFGEVWRVRGPGDTPVALKFIDVSLKHGWKEYRAARWMKEIRHAHLLPMHGLWLLDDNGQPFDDETIERLASSCWGHNPETLVPRARSPQMLIIAMALGDKNLYQRLQECKAAGMDAIPREQLLDYMEDAARGIDYLNSPTHASDQGPVAIQHCDIKPQNILLFGNSAVIADFGLARALGESRMTSVMPGSPAYIAPECIEGKQPSAATDQYSLALTYFELRTGTLPFDEDSLAAVLRAHLRGAIDLERLAPTERAVIRRATAVDPQQRYSSTREMVHALRHAEDQAAESRTSNLRKGRKPRGTWRSGKERARGWVGKRQIAAASAVALLLAAGPLLWPARAKHSAVPVQPAVNRTLDKVATGSMATNAALEQSAPSSAALRRVESAEQAAGVELVDANSTTMATPPGPAALSLARALGMAVSSLRSRGSGQADQRQASTPQQAVPGPESLSSELPGGDRAEAPATGSSEDPGSNSDVPTGLYALQHVRIVGVHRSWPVSVTFSPQGESILTASWDETARLWHPATGLEMRRFEGHTDNVLAAAFCRSGANIVTGSEDGTIRLWDAASGSPLHQLAALAQPVSAVAASPDDQYVAAAGGDRIIRVWDMTTRQLVREYRGHVEPVNDLAFSPDSRQLASAGEDNTVRIWDLDSETSGRILAGHGSFVIHVTFSPDGQYCLSAGWDETARVWNVATGQQVLCLEGHEDTVTGAMAAAAGQVIVTSSEDQTLRVWDARNGQLLATTTTNGGEIYALAVAPDGWQVATAHENDTVSLWKLERRE